MLGREFRITAAKQYNNIYKNGNKIPGKYLIMYQLPNNLGFNRYGFVTSSKVGKAVIRNRIKRQLRELIHQLDPDCQQGNDLVMIVRYHASSADYGNLERDIKGLLRKARLWANQ